ncbi:MAG: metal-dependent hydrolase [Desulfobacterales bacterium]|nr:metal-dependent hydrolase [Desulfobacterales bacterium]
MSSFASSASATLLFAAGLVRPQEVLLYFVMGVVGGLLPDIDSDSSLTVRLLFTFIATVLSFLIMFHQESGNSALELYLIWLGSFFVMNYIFFSLFTRITVHRGLIHSVPASALFGLLTVLILYHCFNFSLATVWMAGTFISGGFLLHLALDEFVSLNLSGKNPKKSAGTAFKFGSARDIKSTFAVYFILIILAMAAPDHKSFLKTYFSADSYSALHVSPQKSWFEDLIQRYVVRWKTR